MVSWYSTWFTCFVTLDFRVEFAGIVRNQSDES